MPTHVLSYWRIFNTGQAILHMQNVRIPRLRRDLAQIFCDGGILPKCGCKFGLNGAEFNEYVLVKTGL